MQGVVHFVSNPALNDFRRLALLYCHNTSNTSIASGFFNGITYNKHSTYRIMYIIVVCSVVSPTGKFVGMEKRS